MVGAADSQLLTFEEVSKHTKKFDCWLIISGKVMLSYLFTQFGVTVYSTGVVCVILVVKSMYSLGEVRKTDYYSSDLLNLVYDVTPFLDDHPGGEEILLMATAKDATDDFDDVNHSEEATGMLKSYYIGDFDTSTLPGKQQYNEASVDGLAQKRKSAPKSLEIFQFLVPLLIVGIAYALYRYSIENKTLEI